MGIGESFNFEDVFFRDLTVCVLDTIEGQVRWVNKFTSGDVAVQVPFYYSLTGDERFLLDSFSDDIVSNNRYVDLNTDMIPRGHLTMTGFNIKSDEFANPNVWLRMIVENDVEIKKVLTKVRAVPVTVSYDLVILLNSEGDTFKCSQAILDTMWLYRFMYFEYNFMNIDAVILMPDTNSIEMSREKNMTSDNSIKLKVSFTVETYYPAFRRDRINNNTSSSTTGMKDSNGYSLTGGYSTYFNNTPQSPSSDISVSQSLDDAKNKSIYLEQAKDQSSVVLSATSSSISVVHQQSQILTQVLTQSADFAQLLFQAEIILNSSDIEQIQTLTTSLLQDIIQTQTQNNNLIQSLTKSFNEDGSSIVQPQSQIVNPGFDDSDYYSNPSPKRTKWFNNILRSRENSSLNKINPNGDKGPNGK